MAFFLLALAVGVYLYRELTRDVLIIEPFNVPKEYADKGFTDEVIANHVSDALAEIEKDAITKEKRAGLRVDTFVLSGDLPTTIDVEVPGTKLGLRTLVEIAREVFNIHPKRVRGDVVLSIAPAAAPVSLTVRVSGARHPEVVRRSMIPDNDPERIPQLAAEAILHDVNPFLLGVYKQYQDDSETVEEIGRELLAGSDRLDRARGHDLMGLVDTARGRLKDAVAEYRQATELAPDLSFAYANWGFMLDNLDKAGEAITKYQKAVQLDPSYARAYVVWGYTLYKQGKPAEAEAKFQEAVRRDPGDPVTYDFWGAALAERGKEVEAFAKFEQALELDPKYWSTYTAWGDTLTRQEKWEDAAEKYRKAIETGPKSATPYYSWGAMLSQQGKLDDAIAKFRLASQIDPGSAYAYNAWGVILFKQNKMEEAIAKFQKATQIDPKSLDAYNNWGNALQQLGRAAEAEEKFAKARALSSAP